MYNPIHRPIPHMSEENSGTSLTAHKNVELSHIGITLEFGTGVKIISYTFPLLALGMWISFQLHQLY